MNDDRYLICKIITVVVFMAKQWFGYPTKCQELLFHYFQRELRKLNKLLISYNDYIYKCSRCKIRGREVVSVEWYRNKV